MRKFLCFLFVVLLSAPPTTAKTDDDDDDCKRGHHGHATAVTGEHGGHGDDDDDDDCKPPRKTVCDHLKGSAYLLCIAYCEELKCAGQQRRTSTKVKLCNTIRSAFKRITGTPPPCDAVCPCPESLPLFAAFVNGTEPIQECFITPVSISVTAADNQFSIVENSAAGLCSDNLLPPLVPLTDAEALTCRTLLLNTAASQGVPCVPPE